MKGYPTLQIKVDGKHRRFSIHRIVATVFIPNPDGKPCINHIDGNTSNNAEQNLEWCTHSENTRHAIRTGLFKGIKGKPGEDSPSAKLTESKVRTIKRRLILGWTQQSLATLYGVSKGTIGFINRGETWGHVKP